MSRWGTSPHQKVAKGEALKRRKTRECTWKGKCVLSGGANMGRQISGIGVEEEGNGSGGGRGLMVCQ